jgi:hypothetical protein
VAVNTQTALTHLSSVLGEHRAAKQRRTARGGDHDPADDRLVLTRFLAAVERLAPPGSAYLLQVEGVMNEENAALAWQVDEVAAILEALERDYQQGFMQTVVELVHADLFDDFLAMASELHEKLFIGPAAVVAGSVLEEHLRKLAVKHSVSLLDGKGRSKSVEVVGVELRNAGSFNEMERKSVTAWYAQRTEAAHGRFDELVSEEVVRMIDGVRDFIVRHPA